jgi:hypothetical protein
MMNWRGCGRKLLWPILSYYLCICVDLKEEHRLRAYKNRVLKRIFGPKKEQLTGGWRKSNK